MAMNGNMTIGMIETAIRRIFAKAIEHTEEIRNLLLRNELAQIREDGLRNCARMTAILEDVDRNRLYTFGVYEKLETVAEMHEEEINRIKEILKV